ncbi:MAG: DUF1016 domain-containing protein [Planctomycetes bacterium]|nr:DUF1016 domain-containing protein [Planctomycetota bacterium]MBM4079634.1 DUF1016 domain-containing protein [Planctomycetota bacterium]
MSKQKRAVSVIQSYDRFAADIQQLLAEARRQAARSVNAIMTAVYWEIGRRIVEFEQGGMGRADYGEYIIERLSDDLTRRFGRGFGRSNLFQIKAFYLAHPQIVQTPSGQLASAMPPEKVQTVSGESASQVQEARGENHATASRNSLAKKYETLPRKLWVMSAQSPLAYLATLAQAFPLPWSHYVRLLSVRNPYAREFYEAEALRGGWSVRQLDRQIQSQFYERTALSRDKAAMLLKGAKALPEDAVTPEEEIKDPFVLEFLGLKDEYSESDLEEALIQHLETFLLELGGDFAFIGRQKRMRIGNEWYRLDLLFFHRLLRCLLLIDLKVGKFTHADAGQMNLCLNYAREHWVRPGENAPVGLILCSEKDAAVAHYALDGLPSKVLAAEYRTALPDERELAEEVRRTRLALEAHAAVRRPRQGRRS